MSSEDVPTLPALRDEAATLLRKYRRASDGDRTRILRELADVLVSIRGLFTRPDGTPDWKGRSYAYRVFIRDLYGDAGYQKDEMHTVQAAVRYHLGTSLRERLDADTLTEYGLVPLTPRERSRDHRVNRTATLSALTARDLHGGALLAISAAYTVLSRLEPRALDDLDDRERAVAADTLRDLERRVTALRDRLTAEV